jgi:nitroreductase
MTNVWHELLSVAIHAPSPHNVQPWRARIVDDVEAELLIDSTRTLPKEDVTGSFIISTMGMFIEALSILAARKSIALSYELLTDPEAIAPAILQATSPTLIPFARLRLDMTGPVAPEIYDEELFLRRRTSRLPLKDTVISEQSIAALRDLAEEWQQSFDVTVDEDRIERLLELNTKALFEDLNSPGYHDEIVEWFRYTEGQSSRHRDGLDARCMNTSPVNYWIVANLPQLLLLPVAGKLFTAVYRRQTGRVPALGFISGSFWRAEDGINAGRFLMRFWLETARRGLYIHPYGNLVTNHAAADAMEKELAVKNIWLIFKIGHSEEPPKSRRLPLEKILTT